MIFLAGHGYRCMAHDRRGHGRSSQPWDGNDMGHYADDQVVPTDAAFRASETLVPHATLIVYPGAPHGLTETHKDKVNADLLAFIRE